MLATLGGTYDGVDVCAQHQCLNLPELSTRTASLPCIGGCLELRVKAFEAFSQG